MNDNRSRILDDFRLRAFFSHKALSRKPRPKKMMQVIKRGIKAWISL
jgi:hypothetical protein